MEYAHAHGQRHMRLKRVCAHFGARGEKQKNNSPPDKLMSMSVEVVKGAKSLRGVP